MPKGVQHHKQNKRVASGSKKAELGFREDQQFYARLEKANGNCYFTMTVYDFPVNGKTDTRIGILRRGLARKVRVKVGDVVLACEREYDPSKMDIAHVYSRDDVRQLVAYAEIPNGASVVDDAVVSSTDNVDDIVFENI